MMKIGHIIGSIMKKFIGLKLVLLASFVMLSACNSVQGIGRDIQSAGKGVQEQF